MVRFTLRSLYVREKTFGCPLCRKLGERQSRHRRGDEVRYTCFSREFITDFNLEVSCFGGLEVACWPLVTKFAGSHLTEAVGFLGRKILNTPFFGGEVNSSVLCRNFTACKRSLNVRWSSVFRQN
jgi:hypothetical protein